MKNGFYKILSIILSVSLIFSVCGVVVSAEDTALADNNYYVLNGGTGDGRTEKTPAATVHDVIAAVNEDLGEGDTANIYIMQREDYKLIADVDGTKYNQMTAWSANGEILPEHKAAIVVQPYSKDVTTHLSFTNIPVTNKDLVIAGPTTFKNITFVSNKKYDAGIVTNKHSVIFGDGVNYLYTNTDPDNYWFATGVTSLSTALAKDIGESAYTEKIDIVFENKFISKELNTTSFVIGSGNYAIQAFSEDVNITFNNASAKPRILWGNNNAAGGRTEFYKNLNINVKSAASVTNVQGNRPVTVTGGIQFIVNSATAVSGDISDFTNITATGGKWYITSKLDYGDLFKFTANAGTYEVGEGYTAVTTDAEGNKTMSQSGVLTLAAGVYELELINTHNNDGETISVYEQIEIDLAKEKHSLKDGKVFVGWKNADGEYVEQVATYNNGDVLTAEYVDFAKDSFIIEESQIRQDDKLGLRFVVKQNKKAVAALPNISEYGTISLPTDAVLEEEFSLEGNTYSAVKTTAENILEETELERKYTLCITDIEADKYDNFYSARGYIKFINYNGVESVIYTDTKSNSLYKIAVEAVNAGVESEVYDAVIADFEATLNIENIQKIARIGYLVYNSNTPPEQSLASFEMAYNAGYRILLCDVRTTSDGEFVCLHDKTINSVARNADGTEIAEDKYINDITLSEADEYDFGIKKGAEYAGTKILRLKEFLELCKKLDACPHLELKETFTDEKRDEKISLVKQYGFEYNIMFNGSSNDMRYIGPKLPNAILGQWVLGITDARIKDIATFGDNKKFIYVSNGYANTITAENYIKCLENGIDIGFTEIRYKSELDAMKELGALKYCTYVATRIFDLE